MVRTNEQKQMRVKGKVTNGKLKIEDRNRLARWLTEKEGETIEAVFSVRKPIRSLSQNEYYWGVVVDILADETGYAHEEMHEILKAKFLQKEVFLVTKIGKETLRTVQSTTDLNTTDFEKYLSDIRFWASAELNVLIPLPNENIDF